MADLTEIEIFDCLRSNLRKAAENCENLAKLPAQGPTYARLREELELIEGAARQAGAFREDMRWNAFGFEMHRFHERIGDAIRSREARNIFLRMGSMIRGALAEAERLRTARTGRRGVILPKAQPGPLRQGRPVQVPAVAHVIH